MGLDIRVKLHRNVFEYSEYFTSITQAIPSQVLPEVDFEFSYACSAFVATIRSAYLNTTKHIVTVFYDACNADSWMMHTDIRDGGLYSVEA